MPEQKLEKENVRENAEENLSAAEPEKPEPAQEEKPEPESEKISLKGLCTDAMDIAEAAVATVFVFMLLFAYMFRPITVDGPSMNPTLYTKDQVFIVSSAIYHPTNRDIVVMDDKKGGLFADEAETVVYPTTGLNKILIKRLIAKEGQEINIDFVNGTVAVDGVQQIEPYIAALTTRNDGAFTYPFTVPEGYIFVMGDNRIGSTDSRSPSVGLIPKEQIIGTALFRYDRDEERCQSWKDRFAWLFRVY